MVRERPRTLGAGTHRSAAPQTQRAGERPREQPTRRPVARPRRQRVVANRLSSTTIEAGRTLEPPATKAEGGETARPLTRSPSFAAPGRLGKSGSTGPAIEWNPRSAAHRTTTFTNDADRARTGDELGIRGVRARTALAAIRADMCALTRGARVVLERCSVLRPRAPIGSSVRSPASTEYARRLSGTLGCGPASWRSISARRATHDRH
jgi:hypothetical protein